MRRRQRVHADSCDLGTHTCSFHTGIPGCCSSMADCNDGNACTTDTCNAGTCNDVTIPGCCLTDGDCDDQNSCTVDACDLATNTRIHGGRRLLRHGRRLHRPGRLRDL